ncbi:MAG TPA: aminotransferase class III-fold pyridoxal phosphate-dependent enzyme [Saprospiraceae bacterium]|nr:aminotransferase class III-fold pyridoxal phosphate-dependent enzyme [Saprospiraceae bacterium]HNT21826.1 aminotransferase class III-fold pyridoxal phosphate-dependent enzyme [Saprospiraceae bacterium]
MHEEEIKDLLKKAFRLEGRLTTLYSELDAVYVLDTAEGGKLVVKQSHPGRDPSILEMEDRAILYLNQQGYDFQLQEVFMAPDGDRMVRYQDHHFRVFKWIALPLWAECKPVTANTRKSLGKMMGRLSSCLAGFEDPAAHRFIKWDPSRLLWIRDFVHLHPDPWNQKFIAWLNHYEKNVLPLLDSCPKQINYNDANDYNVLCRWNEEIQSYETHALLDFLDMVYTHRINELAIACTYAILKLPDPLRAACEVVGAFHKACPLEEAELEVLYAQITARLMISLTVSAINRQDHPENQYLQVTDRDAWSLLEAWLNVHPRFAGYSFRAACEKKPVPGMDRWIQKIGASRFHPVLDHFMDHDPYLFDFGVGSTELGNFSVFTDDLRLDKQVRRILEDHGTSRGIGRYKEIRPFYTSEAFRREGNEGPDWRTVHLGLDLFAPAGTVVRAPCSGRVHSIRNNGGHRDYGPTLILEHYLEEFVFYTLYGHLGLELFSGLDRGQAIPAGFEIGKIGNIHENGGWPPHLHFQIILDLLDHEGDYPGVASPGELIVWEALSPDPALITGIFSLREEEPSLTEMLRLRKERLGPNLSVSYREPLWIRRGMMQYLLDQHGRRYLDTVNNVAHCGHENPRIVDKGRKAMAVLNTNTRYLHENILGLAEQLTAALAPSLRVCYFTNSGTEANELAIRMAKQYAGQEDILAMQWAYHGNSSLMIDLSSYKFNRKGGRGKPPHTHLIPMPDPFRGKYAGRMDQAEAYFKEVENIINGLKEQGHGPAALFAESILSCGGQIVYPDGFLDRAVAMVRAAGGLYIADEVQTGLWRTGRFCAYEFYGVVPDIVTFGKPLGNGHPVGAVVCTRPVAEAFHNGMEYFNTFGGNPVSCAIAGEVLRELMDQKSMDRAKEIGDSLKAGLKNIQTRYPLIADIRGHGFFLGIELMKNGLPASAGASYLAGRMRQYGILMSTDGPDDNVLKFKPPMCFTGDDATQLLDRLEKILAEDPLRI